MPHIFVLSLPHDTKWQAERALQFIEQFIFSFPHSAFRIVAEQSQIEWQIVVFDEVDISILERSILASYPDMRIEERNLSAFGRLSETEFRYICKYQQTAETFLAPIKHVDDIRQTDPLAALVTAMANLRAGERIAYTLIVFGSSEKLYKTGMDHLYQNHSDSLVSIVLPKKVQRYRNDIHHVLLQKHETKLFQALLFIQIDTPIRERLRELIVVDSQMVLFDREQFNGLRRIVDTTVYQVEDDTFDFETGVFGLYQKLTAANPTHSEKELRKRVGLVLEPREIAALWHLPHDGFSSTGITWKKKDYPISPSLAGVKEGEGLGLGMGSYQGRAHPVYWQHTQRTTHMSIVGKGGTGKSSFLHALIHQDIQAGRGIAVIDPHGNKPDGLIRRILQTSIPTNRETDVVIIDLANRDYPPPLNLLATSKTDASPIGAGEVIGLIERVYEDMEATRWRDTLSNVLFTLWQDDNPTLLDVDRLFTDPSYRSSLVNKIGIENFPVLQFWDSFEPLSDGQKQNLRQPVAHRLRSLIGNPHLFPMLCHPNSLNISTLIADNRIILISLGVDNQSVPDTEQNLLAALLIAAIEKAAFARSATHLFPIYIDEAQRFVSSSLPKVFSEVRKSGVAFTLANQYIKQLPDKVKDAIYGNVGAIIAFQTNADDAAYLTKYMRPTFDPDDLIQMDKFHAAAWLREGDKTQPAFSLSTPSPITPNNANAALNREQTLRKRSIERFTPISKDAILSWIKSRYRPAGTPTDDHLPPSPEVPPDVGTYESNRG